MLLCLSVINIHQITEVHPSSARQSLETAQQGVRGLVQTAAACSMMLQSGHLQPAAWPRHLVSTLTVVVPPLNNYQDSTNIYQSKLVTVPLLSTSNYQGP